MKWFNGIPTTDYIGRRVRINEKATMFSMEGIHYEGNIRQVGGKRWFEADDGKVIGGLGSMELMKGCDGGIEECDGR